MDSKATCDPRRRPEATRNGEAHPGLWFGDERVAEINRASHRGRDSVRVRDGKEVDCMSVVPMESVPDAFSWARIRDLPHGSRTRSLPISGKTLAQVYIASLWIIR